MALQERYILSYILPEFDYANRGFGDSRFEPNFGLTSLPCQASALCATPNYVPMGEVYSALLTLTPVSNALKNRKDIEDVALRLFCKSMLSSKSTARGDPVVDHVNLPLEVLALAATADSTSATATATALQAKNSAIRYQDQCTIAARCCACNRWYATSLLSLCSCLSLLSSPFTNLLSRVLCFRLNFMCLTTVNVLQEIDAVCGQELYLGYTHPQQSRLRGCF
jgi:hypothetical protein